MATISAWKGERSRVGGALWHLAFKIEVLGLCPLGRPLGYVHTAGGGHTQCPPWGPPGHRTPIHVGFQCPQIWFPTGPPALLPARPRPRFALEPPPRVHPLPAPPVAPPRPASRPSSLGLGLSEYSQRAALRADPGKGCSRPGRGSAGPRAPISEPQGECVGTPFHLEAQSALGFVSFFTPTQAPEKEAGGVPSGFPPHPRCVRSGLATHQGHLEPTAAWCASPIQTGRSITLENSRPLCSVGSPPPPGPQPDLLSHLLGVEPGPGSLRSQPGRRGCSDSGLLIGGFGILPAGDPLCRGGDRTPGVGWG